MAPLDSDEVSGLLLAAETLEVPIGDAGVERIGRYIDLLLLWNQRFHLTGERDRRTLLGKHVVDSLTPVPLLPEGGRVIDIGSGAGFPGIILSCLRPDLEVVLLEARRRPCSFLAEAARSIPLPLARIVMSRAEDTIAELGWSAGTIISRAIRLDRLLPLAVPLLSHDGAVIAMQTPATSETDAARLGAPVGLRVAGLVDYRLPGDESRRLIRFVRA
ncbi:MAG TPA: 16S rRNA (guanine(527)-N(7))-methyltransferase RsmG [Candidatus Binatia bacterium]|nr:16S rRNA (guanine(527)-N(7))-methyltransferase RsmG [Candidatus Binatia bacterium]